MRKTLVVAAICFWIPIAVVVAMNPKGAERCLKDAHRWAKKTFPEPKPKPKHEPIRC